MPKQYPIHISDVRTYKQCRLRWFYSSPLRLNLERKTPQVAMWGGSVCHVGMEALYDSSPLSLEACLSAYDQWVNVELANLQHASNYEQLTDIVILIRGMLVHYYAWAHKHDDFKSIASEVPFKFPLPHIGRNVYFEGTTDGLVQCKGKAYWLHEVKTTSRFPEPRALFLDDQCRAYPWAARASGDFVGREPIGMIYTFLFKALPEAPNVLKKGDRLSKDKSMKTTAEIYEQEIALQGFEIEQYRDFLAYLRSQPHAFFRRHYIKVEERSLRAFGQQLINVGEEMVNPTTPIFPSRTWYDCEYCPFELPCQMRCAGFDDKPILNALYKEREEYRKQKSKRCSRCKTWKPISEFSKNRAAKDGLQWWCKECHREHKRSR